MAEQADLILHGGDIVTLAERGDERGEAVAVKDGTIVFVGSEKEVLERWRGPHTVVRDLGGAPCCPGSSTRTGTSAASACRPSSPTCSPTRTATSPTSPL
ncbi:hypothetical protein [Streptomyces virginiae]|uniref:hypothetical protein n=1 Tax=Streptomyces virginiae TaxID=1961 RepID=UPI003790BDB8